MVGTPTLQMIFGFFAGAFCGFVIGCSHNLLFGVVGIFLGGLFGIAYAAIACLACGSTLDLWVVAIRSRRYFLASVGLILWLTTSAVLVAGPLGLLSILGQ